MKVSLSNRMKAIVDAVPECYVVADIGCDHGKVLYQLLKTGKCKYGIGSDISEMCAIKTLDLLRKNNIRNCEVTVGDGFNAIKDRVVDAVIIAGMGGYEIIHILESAPKNYRYLVLQPMNHVEEVRRFLADNGYKIEMDTMIEEKGKFYDVLRVNSQGKTKYNRLNFLFGMNDAHNPSFVHYVQENIAKYEEIIKNVPKNKQKDIKKILKYLHKISKKGVKNG